MLGYSRIKDALRKFVDNEDKLSLKDLIKVGVESTPTLISTRLGQFYHTISFNEGKAIYINESGLYSLILASHAPFAKEFKRMVCKIILPSIRKYGEFTLNKELTYIKNQLNGEKIKNQIKDEELSDVKNQLQLKDEQIENLKTSQLVMKNFIENVKSKNKNGYIYIATSKRYASINNFKVGKTDKSVKIRESGFNNTRTQEDRFYICYYKKVYSVDKVEKILHELLDEFRDQKNKEIFIMHYTYLKELVELTIKNLDEPFEYINNLIKNKLAQMYNLRPIIPDEIEVSDEKLLMEEIRDQIYNILDSAIEDNNLELSKCELLKRLNLELNPGQTKLWSIVKDMFKWKNSKTPILYKDVSILIKYN